MTLDLVPDGARADRFARSSASEKLRYQSFFFNPPAADVHTRVRAGARGGLGGETERHGGRPGLARARGGPRRETERHEAGPELACVRGPRAGARGPSAGEGKNGGGHPGLACARGGHRRGEGGPTGGRTANRGAARTGQPQEGGGGGAVGVTGERDGATSGNGRRPCWPGPCGRCRPCACRRRPAGTGRP